jgi:hypothetical protein
MAKRELFPFGANAKAKKKTSRKRKRTGSGGKKSNAGRAYVTSNAPLPD